MMLHWPTSNRPISKHETVNRVGLMLGQNRRLWANIGLPLDQCLVSAEIQHPHNQPQPPSQGHTSTARWPCYSALRFSSVIAAF